MKRWLALLMAFSLSSLAAEPPGLTIYYYDRLPFFGDNEGRPAGLLIDISRLILDEAGLSYRFVNVPVVRIFETLKKTGNACVLGALRTKERETLYRYTDDFIYRDQPFRLIVSRSQRKELSERPTIRQIFERGLRLGLSEGYVYGEWLDGKLGEYRPPSQRINVGSDMEKMYKMLIAGRFDYMFSVAEEARHVIARNKENAENLEIVEIADAPPGNKRYFLCSNAIDNTLMSKINSAVGKVKASRAYEKIVDQAN